MRDNGTSNSQLRIVGLGGTLRSRSLSRVALQRALASAEAAGADIELLDLNELQLPMFVPGQPEADLPRSVAQLLARVSGADGMLWSTGAYHGTLAGVTKNALDHLDHLADRGYLSGIPVGMISVSGGEMAAVTAIDAMVHAAHALRGVVVPLKLPVGKARQRIASNGDISDSQLAQRLDSLGRLVVRMAGEHRRYARVSRAA